MLQCCLLHAVSFMISMFVVSSAVLLVNKWHNKLLWFSSLQQAQYSVQFYDNSENGRAGQGGQPEVLQEKVHLFHSKGFCLFDSIFSSHNIDKLKSTALSNFDEIQSIIQSTNQDFGVGLKQGYDEIVQRQAGRYEVPYKMKDIFKDISDSPELLEIIHAILGPDIVIANESLIISMPGTTDQVWHADGPHMSVTEHLPAHCLNVFIPLVDITPEEGPTEFRPASHYLTRDLQKMFLLAAMKKQLLPTQKPLMAKGSALLFDYRILHRGTANRTDSPRPVYVLTFGKKWYRDPLNYPHRSVFGKKSGACVAGVDSAKGEEMEEECSALDAGTRDSAVEL